MDRNQYRRAWIRAHNRYMRKGLAIFRKGMRTAANRIPFDNLTEQTYQISVLMNVNLRSIEDAYFELYNTIGLQHGNRVGKGINREIQKNFDPASFQGSFEDFIRQWLTINGGQRIVSARQGLVDYIIAFISERIDGQTDIRTIARELEKHIRSRSFYRWQIERIVRTETTAAANLGALRATNNSGIVSEKVWISTNDSRTRRTPPDEFDHIEMDGVRVGENEFFNVQGDRLEYPGDPRGQAGNVINCRCTVAVVPRRDENGRLVFRNSFALA